MALNPKPKIPPSPNAASSPQAGQNLEQTPQKTKSFWDWGFRIVVVILAVAFTINLAAHFTAEILWFEKFDYLSAFLVRCRTQFGLWAIAFFTSAIFLWGNLILTDTLKWNKIDLVEPTPRPRIYPGLVPTESKPSSRNLQFPIPLTVLLPLILTLCILVGLMLVHYAQVALEVWKPDYNLPTTTPSLPSPFNLVALVTSLPRRVGGIESLASWSIASVVGTVLLLLANPRWCLRVISVAISLIFGFVISGNWSRLLLFFNETPFERTDPIFNLDIGFYLYKLPLWQLLYFWLGGLSLYGLIACLLIYILSGDSVSRGQFIGFSALQLRHLSGLASAAMAMQSLHHWLARYELLYSTRGTVYGIGYTDYYVERRVELILFFLAGAIATWLLLRMLGTNPKRIFPKPQLRGIAGFYIIAIAIGIFILPGVVQQFGVQPNELARETPFLRHSIEATRAAFDLDENNIEVRTFNPQAQLTLAQLEENQQTVDNIRLWDTRPILTTLRQLQQIRLYYSFPSADVDRYTLPQEPQDTPAKQQVIIAARELDYSTVPAVAKTWVNQHLVYTHGYGFVVSPVNQVAEGGLPDYFVRDIGTADQEGVLLTSSEAVERNIPTENPRIYYGELTKNYIMTPSKVPELDFPSGNENVYTTYEGTGGIPLNSLWRKLIFAAYLKDWQMLFTQNFQPDTRILFRRDLNRRLRAIAPFLRYDIDPYLVSVDAEIGEQGSGRAGERESGGENFNLTPQNLETSTQNPPPNYLYWIIDAYTTSDHYPYSDPGEYPFNYTRNAVKIVLNAYNGDVHFYVAEPDDPLIQSWQRIFPKMFQPLSAMPEALRAHIRYPADLLEVQSERLLAYHMTDTTVFYNREDQWEIPTEIYGSEQQLVKPYHLIMKLPTATDEEFILLQPFTPVARPNLIAWLAARSDGKNYGKLLLYQFPKQQLVFGVDQIEALINQDPVISQLISLWDTQGSQAVQGNLLVIPVERSLLYVEPLYLEAENNGLPTLVRVIVAFDNKIAIAETLQQAFEKLFPPRRGEQPPIPEEAETPAIIRTLEEITP
ncbi:MAG: UPF0182 family protein [Cyanobacteriota bacterium]|nr:UPF0182 family protein [Cyanobacteriota bacterium]